MDSPTQQSTDRIWSALPKVELHVHLEGAVSYNTVISEFQKQGIPLPFEDSTSLRKYFTVENTVKDLATFLEIMHRRSAIFSGSNAISRITKDVILEKARQNVKLLELRYPPTYLAFAGKSRLSLLEVHSAVKKGVEEASAECSSTGQAIHVCLLAAVTGTATSEDIDKTVAFAIENKRDFCGFDITGGSADLSRYSQATDRISAAGLKITVHACEEGSPKEAGIALQTLHAARISHATQILKDPEVYNMAKKLRVPIEVLVSSNLKTSAVATVWDHPIKQFLQDGISVSISTDDPGIFGTDLNGEYELLHQALGLTATDFFKINRDSLGASFATDEIKNLLMNSFFSAEAEKTLVQAYR